MTESALFDHRDGLFIPGRRATGPWRDDAQHGGPPSALLGRACEAAIGADQRLARLTIELVRPVPLEPLRVAAVPRTVSRRVTMIDCSITDVGRGQVVAIGRAMALTVSDLPEPGYLVDESSSVPGPETIVVPDSWRLQGSTEAYHRDGVEHRVVSGGFGTDGPADQWARLRQPLVAGEETTGIQRLLAVADFGSGVSAIYGKESGVGLINADITVAFQRPPQGEWVRLQSVTRIGPEGIGLATTVLSDEDGPVATAVQSLLGLVQTG